MSKLEEIKLGIASREVRPSDVTWLIERVEELERQVTSLAIPAKRQEISQQLGEIAQLVTERDNVLSKNLVQKAQLQAARELADAAKLWHNRQPMHSFKLEDCRHLVCTQARDFLKMLEGE